MNFSNRAASLVKFTGLLLGVFAAIGVGASLIFFPRSSSAMGDKSRLKVAELIYPTWEELRPSGFSRLLWMATRRTSLKPDLKIAKVKVSSKELFNYPLIYMVGEKAFPPWPPEDIIRLRIYLSAGGTLFINMTDGEIGGPFDRSVRRLVKRLFPKSKLRILPSNHTLFRSFYLLRRFGGRRLLAPYIMGIIRDERSPIIYSLNDHLGAWERDNFGNWIFPVIPGGEFQREHAFRFGINLIMYALCVNYKQDAVHVKFIMRRRK